ncbi:hypothetical protein DIURU_001593 [Diutina rugosa]|uniref:Uncharacterized protein n=1 Tax=Diutina rugosa TaxID=5481 RepID=A0A642UTP6_DIURU|nr:uncharacterized protein DIURU_001593 [Diutina rugosa]KAA8905165.1 hypothetical protein DIURU_001593 [Diutina rugosa]
MRASLMDHHYIGRRRRLRRLEDDDGPLDDDGQQEVISEIEQQAHDDARTYQLVVWVVTALSLTLALMTAPGGAKVVALGALLVATATTVAWPPVWVPGAAAVAAAGYGLYVNMPMPLAPAVVTLLMAATATYTRRSARTNIGTLDRHRYHYKQS